MGKAFVERFNTMSNERRAYALRALAQHLYQASQCNRLHELMVREVLKRTVKEIVKIFTWWP